ncbi:MAG TPA: DUF5320 domain-containing protein, partial [bacterium]|nr:DUF5320 domain-containing protein [bacterium]
MPGFDQTGPRGQGPMTGRGLGPCGGMRRGFGCAGFGRGFGFGRFAGRAYLSQQEELAELEDEAATMEADLKALRERITEV